MVSLNYRTAISHHASFSAIEAVPHWWVVRPKSAHSARAKNNKAPSP